MNRRNILSQKPGLSFSICLLGILMAVPASSQTPATLSRQKTSAIQLDQSRAERAAEDMVSLSADKIISLLRTESGLLLQVKKVLVRKAYEQGRLLDPQDLSDDALFRLIREDENVRVLFTREIEDRYYIRAKPTKEELAAGLVSEPLRGQPPKAASPTDPNKPVPTQEEAYWSAHEGMDERYPELYETPLNSEQTPNSKARSTYPQQPRDQTGPEDVPAEPGTLDQRRQIERTDIPFQQGDYPETLTADAGGPMPTISPGRRSTIVEHEQQPSVRSIFE